MERFVLVPQSEPVARRIPGSASVTAPGQRFASSADAHGAPRRRDAGPPGDWIAGDGASAGRETPVCSGGWRNGAFRKAESGIAFRARRDFGRYAAARGLGVARYPGPRAPAT